MYANLCSYVPQLSRLRCFVLTLTVLFMSTSLLAQHGHPGNKKSEAELHIRVRVVPVVMRPPHKKHAEDSAISYNLFGQKQDMEIREEIRSLVGITGSGGTTDAVLKTVTIVLQ